MIPWFATLERRALLEEPRNALANEVASHVRLCAGTMAILLIGDIEGLVVPPANVPTFRMPMPAPENIEPPQVPDPEMELPRKSDKLVIYAPIALIAQWTRMAEDLKHLSSGRRQIIVVMILPGLGTERVIDFRWMLSALLDQFADRRYDVTMTFFPKDVRWNLSRTMIEFFAKPLLSGRLLSRRLVEVVRSAISYDMFAGVRRDPDRFLALLISIKPRQL